MSEPLPSQEIVQYPLLPLRDVVVFPHMVIPLFVGRPKSIKAMETAMEAGKSILLVAQKSAAKDDPGPGDMYSIGCVSNILQMLKLPDGTVKVLVEGGARAHIREVVDVRSHWIAEAVAVPPDGTPPPEVEAMRRAAGHMLGERDFSALRASGCTAKTSTRRVDEIDIRQPEPALMTIDVRGNAFLRNMVRIMAGTLVAVGEGRLRADDIPDILAARDRARAGQTAPPHGLTLVRVLY